MRRRLCTDGYADLTSKKSPVTIFPSRHLFRIQVVRMTPASSTLSCFLPPIWVFESAPEVLAQKVTRLVMTFSYTLPRQLSSAIGRYELGCE